MRQIKSQKGFTLLELLISLMIFTLVIMVTMQVIRLAVTSREISDKKLDTLQRLRFINEQLNSKIRSIHPLFIPKPGKEDLINRKKPKSSAKILAFQGKSDSIKFITFAEKLDSINQGPQIHEVQIYLGTHPETDEEGILMLEREITSFEDIFKDDSENNEGNLLLLADEVDHLEFKFYQVNVEENLTPDDSGKIQSLEYKGEWVDTINQEVFGLIDTSQADSLRDRDNDDEPINLPRAIEFSLGIFTDSFDEENGERELITLPPTIIPIHSGMVFERTILEDGLEQPT